MKDILIIKADKFVYQLYQLTRKFPKSEIYGLTSQLRRSSLSIILNIIEGQARRKRKETHHFYEISYGSLKETKYLLYFCHREDYIKNEDYLVLLDESEELGKLIWSRMKITS